MPTPIQAMLDRMEMTPVDSPHATEPGLPWVTHEGMLSVAGHSIRVYQLNTGQRIIPQDDMESFFEKLAGEFVA